MSRRARTVEELADALRRFREARDRVEGSRELTAALIRHLGRGEPMSGEDLDALAGERGFSAEAVGQVLRFSMRDVDGRIVGIAGLTLNPTLHRLILDGRILFTWCPWDGLFLVPILGADARLESTSPADGARVSVEMTPRGVTRVEPEEAVLSVVVPRPEDVPSTAHEVMGVFCHYVHFFASRDAAAVWVPADQDVDVLSVEDGFRLGRLVYGDLFTR